MHQRSPDLAMDVGLEEQTTAPQSRGRNNSKLKVLVRSHAMREETSPPREPTPTLISPCIKLTPSPTGSPNNHPVVVLSPSISRGNSPSRSSMCTSPTSTLVLSPTARCSPLNLDVFDDHQKIQSCTHQTEFIDTPDLSSNRVHNNNKANKQTHERSNRTGESKAMRDIILEENSYLDLRKTKSETKCTCDYTNQGCVKCVRNQDRNTNNLSSNGNNNQLSSPNTLMVNRSGTRGKLRQQSSSQGSFEGSSSNSPCLSRDSSSEQYTDTTGVDLEVFIPDTLNRNAKDRALLLRIEQELVNLAKDKIRTHYKFPPMSSYQRMLVHRCAAYFGMDHNIEQSGKCVVVNKTKNTRIPDVEFKQHIKEDIVFSEEPRRSILKRDSNSIEDYSFKSPDRQFSLENRRSKSFEEREEEYEKARRRIFNRDMQDASGSTEDLPWSDVPWSSTESDTSSRLRLQPPDYHSRSMGRLLKVHSEDIGEETMRPHVAKSYSFGGYGGVSVLTRGDSCMSTHSAGPRLLTKQDSGASSVSWRLSPSSSGYKTQSQRSESITPSPTSTPYLSGDSIRQDSTNSNVSDIPTSQPDEQPEPQLVWAVTDIHSVPKGSIIINPKTLEPVKNQDGTIYHYDPTNPPPRINNNSNCTKPPPSPQKVQSPQKCNNKERPLSPKRKSRSSPVKKSSMTNSSTSPSLPYTPPLHQSRSFTFSQSNESVSNAPMQQQYPVFGGNYGPPPDGSVVFQQPCVVYTAPSYGMPVAYENRIDPSLTEVPPGYYINVGDNTNNPSSQSLTYQTSPQVWNQQPIAFYQNTTPPNPPQRFAVPLANQPTPYLSATYPPNYMPHPSQGIQQTPPNSEVVPVYPQQSVQVVYPTPPQGPPLYSNQSIIYTQNPLYSNPIYPGQNINYPVCTSTTSSCTSSASNTGYCGQMQEPNMHVGPQSFAQLSQSMGQLSLSGPNSSQPNFGQGSKIGYPMVQYDMRAQKPSTPKGNKFSNIKKLGSSQSSTGTSSPATTVVAGYNPAAGLYRTPSETPPTPHMPGGYTNFMQPMLMRQGAPEDAHWAKPVVPLHNKILYDKCVFTYPQEMSNVHASPPITNRNSRSPTPASDISHVDRHRMPLPPTVYHRMPYVLQSETRIISRRGQPSAYRQPSIRQQTFNQGSDNNSTKGHKNRKSRGNKSASLPPNGKT